MKILLGLIIAIILVLSVKIKLAVDFDEKLNVVAKCLFIKYSIYPESPKKKKKAKKAKKQSENKKDNKKSAKPVENNNSEKEVAKAADVPNITGNVEVVNEEVKTEPIVREMAVEIDKIQNKPDDAAAENTQPEINPGQRKVTVEYKKEKPKKKKKENMFTRFVDNQGYSGVLYLLGDAVRAVNGMFSRLGRAFLFDNIVLYFIVGSSDSADTAVKYGKVSAYAFPAMGFIASKMRVKKYNLEVVPDFIHSKSSARFHIECSVRPIKLINALIISGIEIFFKVILKFLKYGKKQNNK